MRLKGMRPFARRLAVALALLGTIISGVGLGFAGTGPTPGASGQGGDEGVLVWQYNDEDSGYTKPNAYGLTTSNGAYDPASAREAAKNICAALFDGLHGQSMTNALGHTYAAADAATGCTTAGIDDLVTAIVEATGNCLGRRSTNDMPNTECRLVGMGVVLDPWSGSYQLRASGRKTHEPWHNSLDYWMNNGGLNEMYYRKRKGYKLNETVMDAGNKGGQESVQQAFSSQIDDAPYYLHAIVMVLGDREPYSGPTLSVSTQARVVLNGTKDLPMTDPNRDEISFNFTENAATTVYDTITVNCREGVCEGDNAQLNHVKAYLHFHE